MSGPNVAEGAVGKTIWRKKIKAGIEYIEQDFLLRRGLCKSAQDKEGGPPNREIIDSWSFVNERVQCLIIIMLMMIFREQTFWVGRSRSYMASPSSIWSAQLDPISTLRNPVKMNQGFIQEPSETSTKGSKQLTATVPAAPGALYVEPPSGPKNSVRFRVLPFPPRPFFPAEFKDYKGPKMAFLRGQSRTHLSRPFGSFGVWAHRPRIRQIPPSSSSGRLCLAKNPGRHDPLSIGSIFSLGKGAEKNPEKLCPFAKLGG